MRHFAKAHWVQFATGVAMLAALAASAPVAHAVTLTCGDTVGPGGTVVLEADVSGCAGVGSPALTVVGPVTFDMAGHRVRCAAVDPADGIHVIGEHARIQNGSVRACGYGLSVQGGGRHTLTGIAANGNVGRGIEVTSERNTLSRCSMTSNADEGLHVSGERNRLDHCVATSGTAGIVLAGNANRLIESEGIATSGVGIQVGGEGNQVSRCAATNNDQAGFSIAGAENKIRESHSVRNTQQGFLLTGDGNSLSQNIATRNATHGFTLNGTSSTRLDDNLAISNAGQGIDVGGDHNDVTRNHAANNGLVGIQFGGGGGGVGNVFEENVSMENSGNDVKDTTACAGATWTDNSFGTANDPCIQ